MISISLFWGYFRWIWCCNVHTCIYIHLGKIFRKPVIHVHVHVLDRPDIHVQIIDGHGWLAIVTGVATGNMHLPGGMIQMKSMSRRCKVCSLFFACIIWYFPKYCLLLCRVLYHPTVARLHTRFCLRSHPRTVVVEHTAVVRDSLEEFE